jgi:uncharacterized protein YutE (UPF0331/DUF86 family)
VTPGPMDLKVVNDALAAITSCLADLRALPQGSLAEFTADRRNPAAAESLVRRTLQTIFDLLRHLVAKGQGQGMLEYKQVARFAAERGLVRDPRLAALLVDLAGYRNRMVHFYTEVTPEELYGILHGQLGDLAAIAEELRRAAERMTAAA